MPMHTSVTALSRPTHTASRNHSPARSRRTVGPACPGQVAREGGETIEGGVVPPTQQDDR